MCQLVAKLVSSGIDERCVMGSQREEKIQRAMLLRLHDKVSDMQCKCFSASVLGLYAEED